MDIIAILNSRQSKTPMVTDDWVVQTLAAVEYVAARGDRIISSAGLFTWDLVTGYAAKRGCALDLVIPVSETENRDRVIRVLSGDFGLDPSRVRWRPIPVSAGDRNKKSWWMSRDREVVAAADMILPVSLRPEGKLQQLVSSCTPGVTINRRFAIRYHRQAHHPVQSVDPRCLSSAVAGWDGEYLIHWTRLSHGPWPGETHLEFLDEFLAARDTYCRSGLATLSRILGEGKLRGSSWRVGGRRPMVAFTALSPIESIPLMRWRRRWSRWSFEPYGVAIRRDWAERLGIRPVRYVSSAEWKDLTSAEKPYCHQIGKGRSDWPAEREWRAMGDVDLRTVPVDAVRVLVRERGDIDRLPPIYRSRAFPFAAEAGLRVEQERPSA